MALHIYRGVFEFEIIWRTLKKALELNNLMMEKAFEPGFIKLNLFRLVHWHKNQNDEITLYTKRNSK